jgi:hypothetical protein
VSQQLFRRLLLLRGSIISDLVVVNTHVVLTFFYRFQAF